MVSAHEVKLAVINNPGVNAYAIAAIIGVSPVRVYSAMNALNINRKSKPDDCVG